MIVFKAMTAILFALVVMSGTQEPVLAGGAGSHSRIRRPNFFFFVPAEGARAVPPRSGTRNGLCFVDENEDGINDLIADRDGDGIPDDKHVDLYLPARDNPPSGIGVSSGSDGAHSGSGSGPAGRGR